ncbi:B/F/G family RNA polymerase sigma-70 factor [Amycolatopsis sp. WAC 01375]|uniref:SigB/SigF/SigG family RNA polymerase sigma factor n=1 Tax=unclassified Amycolatopsis TaxID=2618356 RepID=UPI000F766A39|nr:MULTISPECIES: SigB/SigF/SigG family RNA polymerase sigma factor [unclassified Amycolatopsis]RSM76451.1 B/F/G family RNA polymerase sigma-70 factor [Amycolatopsis sp. WAC 01375]RSN33326.1 B/F/G family RNA polymerase sigma-70 factor [Amycolatopsis sp. WAC 01416]
MNAPSLMEDLDHSVLREEREQVVPSPRDRPSGRARKDDYSHCRPLFDEMASLPDGHPDRRRLRERLILELLPIAEHIAARFSGRGQPREDLVQVARIGLMKAVDRFDPGMGGDFLAFAVPTVMGEVRRFFRDTGWAVHVPRGMQELRTRLSRATTELTQTLGRAPTPTELAGHLDVAVDTVREGLLAANSYQTSSLDRPVNDGEGSLPLSDVVGELDSRFEHIEDRHTVVPLLEKLPERERAILAMRFFEGLTQSQIAERVGISQMHVSRLLTKTLQELRGRFKA